jgi:hypothetical protein
MPNTQAGGPPLVGCSRLRVQYIRSNPPYLEAISPIRNLRTRHAVVTYHGLNKVKVGKKFVDCNIMPIIFFKLFYCDMATSVVMLTLIVVIVVFVVLIVVAVVGDTSSCDSSGCTVDTGSCDCWGTG